MRHLRGSSYRVFTKTWLSYLWYKF